MHHCGTFWLVLLQCCGGENVRGEPVCSVMAAGWFCEKSGWIGSVEDVKPVFLKIKHQVSIGNHFEEEDFYPGWIVKQADFIQFDLSRAKYHLVLGFRLYVQCRLVSVWWMANMRSFCFIKPAYLSMPKFLAGRHYNEEEISRYLKQKYRILAGPNWWQQVCNRWNREKTGRSCEGVDFSWLSSKVSQTLGGDSQTDCVWNRKPFFLSLHSGQVLNSSPGILIYVYMLTSDSWNFAHSVARSCPRILILRSVLKWGKDNRTGSWLDSTVNPPFPVSFFFSLLIIPKEADVMLGDY
jgi:hypothetical protein